MNLTKSCRKPSKTPQLPQKCRAIDNLLSPSRSTYHHATYILGSQFFLFVELRQTEIHSIEVIVPIASEIPNTRLSEQRFVAHVDNVELCISQCLLEGPLMPLPSLRFYISMTVYSDKFEFSFLQLSKFRLRHT